MASLMRDRSSASKQRAQAAAPSAPLAAGEQQAWVDTTSLRKALTAVKPAVGFRSSIEALSGVMIVVDGGQAHVTSTDMWSSMRAGFSATGDLRALVGFKALTEALKHVRGRVDMRVDDGQLAITSGALTLRVTLFRRTGDWPSHETAFDAGPVLLEHDAASLIDVVNAATAAASTDETRPVLTGLYFEGSEIVASDSYRLFRGLLAAPVKDPLLIPAKLLVAALKGAKGTVRFHRAGKGLEAAIVKTDQRLSRLTIIQGQFPNFRQLVPGEDDFNHHVTIDREEAMALAKQASVISGRTEIPVRLSFAADRVELSFDLQVPDGPSMSGRTPILRSGGEKPEDTFVIGANPTFLYDMLATAGSSDRVTISLISPARPMFIADPNLGVDGDFGMVMPVRLNV